MRGRGFGPSKAVIWAAVAVALLGLSTIRRPLHGRAEACGRELLTAPATSANDGPDFVDPWALSPTGERLGPGFSLEEEGPPLLP